MATQIYVNLPVKELKRSVDFFTGLGFSFNAEFTDDNATCMVIDENIYVMLLVEAFYAQGFVRRAPQHRSPDLSLSREPRRHPSHGGKSGCRWRQDAQSAQGLWVHVPA